jgi:tetratricopeptide (TPR) repeat protein
MNRGIALHNLGRRDESNAVWRSMLPRVADDVRLTGVCLFHLGVAAGDAGRSDEALALFDDALARTAGATDRPDVQEVRGRIYCGKGFALAQRSRMEEANQAWLLGFEASPAEYDNAVSLAHSYHNMKRMDEARRWYLVATELFPAPEVMSNFAMCLAQMRLIDEIKPLLAKALAANPDPHAQASLQYRFGRAYDACGAFPLAIEAYTRATECPTRPETDNTRMPAEVTGDARSENINVGTPTWFAIMLLSRAAAREMNGDDKQVVLTDLDASLGHRITLDCLLNKSMLCVAMGRKADAQEALAAAFALDPEGAKKMLDKFYKGALAEKAAKAQAESGKQPEGGFDVNRD